MTTTTASDILDYLQRRREFCRTLLELSGRQRHFIAEGNYAELLSVVARKQRVLGRLEALKESQPESLRHWKQQRDHLEPALRKRCESLLKDIEDILKELLTEEQFCTETLTRRRDATQQQLEEISNGRSAHRAYGKETSAGSQQFLDINQ